MKTQKGYKPCMKQYCIAGVSKLRPTKPFHLSREAILAIMKKWYINGELIDLVECNIS